jgi:tetratricopeptide (TPR) repeat protein
MAVDLGRRFREAAARRRAQAQRKSAPARFGVFRRIGFGLFAGILGAGTAFYLEFWNSWLGEALPKASDLACQIHERFPSLRSQSSEPRTFTILVARLSYDNDGRQTAHIERALETIARHGAIKVLRTCRVAAQTGDVGGSLLVAESESQMRLERKHADLLIWGEVARAEELLRLRMIAKREVRRADDLVGTYKLNETLDLPKNFGTDLGEALVAIVFSEIAASNATEANELADLLKASEAKLSRLLSSARGIAWTPIHHAMFYWAHGMTAFRLAEVTGDTTWLETSLVSFRAERQLAWRDPLYRARTQAMLGDQAWRTPRKPDRFERNRLEAAVSYYRAALDEPIRESEPLVWAQIQWSYGSALRNLGDLNDNPTQVREAVEVFREVLQVVKRDASPIAWALTQLFLGRTLSGLSPFEVANESLNAAAAAARAALEVFRRDLHPWNWASAQYLHGNILSALGADEPDTRLLHESAAAYRAALEIVSQHSSKLHWGETRVALGDVLIAIGEREGQPLWFEAGSEAIHSVLEVVPKEEWPREWAWTHVAIGNYFLSVGDYQGEAKPLLQAVDAFRAAQEVLTVELFPNSWSRIQLSLGDALRILGELEGSRHHLQEAETALRLSHQVCNCQHRRPRQWAYTNAALGDVFSAQGDRGEGARKFKDAVAAYDAGLSVLRAAKASYATVRVEEKRDRAMHLLERSASD